MGASGVFTSDRIEGVVSAVEVIVEPGRASSLRARMINEELLSEKAREQPIFGWAGWGRNRVYKENGEGQLVDVSVTDSLWIIAFGINGTVGLIALFSSSLLPAFSFYWLRHPAKLWFQTEIAPAAVLSVVITLYMLDCTFNNMSNPVFTLATGGIAGLVIQKQKTKIHRFRTYTSVTTKI
ncbi:hypothetical protein RintRC_7610 [Richelia intracellularis]|nr:hypothetical protein RintRC_7610 [Richelia intracellularis]